MKKITSTLLAICMVLSILAATCTTVSAVTGQDIVNDLRNNYVGKYQYVLNTHGPTTFDCSGLVYYVYKQHGITLPYTTKTNWKQYGTVITDVNQLQSGDILLFGSSHSSLQHAGIYDADGGYIIQALNSKYDIIRKPTLTEWMSSSSWNSQGSNQFQFAIRVLDNSAPQNPVTPSPSSGTPGGIVNPNTTLRWKELNSTYNETTKQLQECLNHIMNAGLTVNGYYNLNTHDAVVAFQRQYGLTVDGDAGPKTLNKVNEVIASMNSIHQHEYTTKYDSAHPHKEYKICSSCSEKEYTGNTRTDTSCDTCVNNFQSTRAASYTADNGAEYILFEDVITWTKAKEICASYERGHLATITSAEEQKIIASLVKKGSRKGYFLGATDKSSEGTFKWITGEKWNYENWYEGEPNNFNAAEHYLEFYADGTWNDNENYEENCGFILEIDPPAHKHTFEYNNKTSHPHEEYKYCTECDYEEFTGKNRKVKKCVECNPHEHKYVTAYESEHPHQQYKYCDGCGDKYHTPYAEKVSSCKECYPHEHNYELKYESEHPHKQYRICEECGKKQYTGQTVASSDCATCNPTADKKTIKLQIGVPYMSIDGTEQEIDPGRGTTPILQNQRTLLPIRMIMESFGAFVLWDETENKVTVYAGNTVMQFWINSKTATVNGTPQSMDVAPILVNGRTFMPLRFIAENLGLTVGWNDANQTITITGNL